MNEISNPEAAVLGVLYEHHHYAHRIPEIMAKRGMNRWADIKFSSIPRILKELEEKKLVQSRTSDSEEEPPKKIYYITDKGIIILKRKIKSFLSGESNIIHPFDLGLANIHVLSSEEIMGSLELYLKSIEERIQLLECSIQSQEKNRIPGNFIAIYTRSVCNLKAEKRWIEEFMEKI
nr:helix-turn-helix transcriptional regulator [uncultured Methanobacterium sp.]